MRILVTGGAGYIGSHCCKALAGKGHEVVVYDSLATGHAEAVRWGPLEVGDVRCRDRLDQVIATHSPELVMHFAALAYVGDSVRDPASYYDVNVVGTLTLLEAMRSQGISSIVFSSSCATYGVPATLPITEATPQMPINPYGRTKLTAERMLIDFESAYGLRWVALRYFNAAGADPDGELWEDHDPETHAIPLAIRAALGLGPDFKIMGTDYPTADGSAVRDYVHVSDLADAHCLAAQHLAAGGESLAVNLSSNQPTSVIEMLAAIERVTGRPVPRAAIGPRAGDPPSLFANADLALERLSWRPRYVSIDEIVRTAARRFAL
jgi:UDP-arabinose 4-epimerase